MLTQNVPMNLAGGVGAGSSRSIGASAPVVWRGEALEGRDVWADLSCSRDGVGCWGRFVLAASSSNLCCAH